MAGQAVAVAPKGELVGKFCRALLVAQGDISSAHAFAQGQGPAWREVAFALKAIDPSSVGEGAGAPTLASPIAADLQDAVRPLTLIGRMTALRRVPHNVRLISAASGTTGAWAGENKPMPLSVMNFDATSLQPLSVHALAAITQELARSSAPSADLAIARDVVAACAAAADEAFIAPENAGTANVKPESVTHAGTTHTSSGNSLSAIDADLRAAVGVLDTANANIDSAVWVLRGRSAAYLSTLRGSGGSLAYPDMGLRGGTLLGLPALVTNAVPMDSDSPTESSISLLCASEVWIADDGEARVEMAQHADLQMDDAPVQGAAQMVSVWQHGLLALRTTRYLDWRLRRAAGCVSIVGVNF